MTKTITATAPGKLILFGEYAVLQGYPAIVAAIDRLATVTLTIQSEAENYTITAPEIGLPTTAFRPEISAGAVFADDLPEAQRQKLEFFCACLRCFLRHQRSQVPPVSIRINTSPFFERQSKSKLGLGSSAALSVALIGALMQLASVTKPSPASVFLLAQEAHFAAQGKIGSGVDLAASAFGGILQYSIDPADRRKAPDYRALFLPDGLFMRFIWSGKSASTTALVQQVDQFRTRDRSGWEAIFQQLGKLASGAVEAFSNNDCQAALDIADAYFRCLAWLDKSSHAPIVRGVHASIRRIAEQHGCIYKSSGAGGGDFGILFGERQEQIEKCTIKINNEGFYQAPLNISEKGLQITVD